MDDTGISREQPCQLLQARGIRERLVPAAWFAQMKGRTTDVANSRWLARICEFTPARARDCAVQGVLRPAADTARSPQAGRRPLARAAPDLQCVKRNLAWTDGYGPQGSGAALPMPAT